MEEMNRLTIMIEWPDKRLMPNSKNGKSWKSTDEVKIRAKQEGYLAAKDAIRSWHGEMTGYVPVRVTFYAPNKIRRDLDNLLACIKPHLDGIAQGIGVDDKFFCPITIDRGVDKFKKGFVMVEIG